MAVGPDVPEAAAEVVAFEPVLVVAEVAAVQRLAQAPQVQRGVHVLMREAALSVLPFLSWDNFCVQVDHGGQRPVAVVQIARNI